MGNTSDSSNEGGSAVVCMSVSFLYRDPLVPEFICIHLRQKKCQELSSSAQLCNPTTKKKEKKLKNAAEKQSPHNLRIPDWQSQFTKATCLLLL